LTRATTRKGKYKIHLREQRGGHALGWYLGVQKNGIPLCSEGEFGGKVYNSEREALLDMVDIQGEYNFLLFNGKDFVMGEKTNLFGILDVPKRVDDSARGQSADEILFFF